MLRKPQSEASYSIDHQGNGANLVERLHQVITYFLDNCRDRRTYCTRVLQQLLAFTESPNDPMWVTMGKSTPQIVLLDF